MAKEGSEHSLEHLFEGEEMTHGEGGRPLTEADLTQTAAANQRAAAEAQAVDTVLEEQAQEWERERLKQLAAKQPKPEQGNQAAV